MSVGMRAQRRVSPLQSVPAPTKGINAIDPLASMAEAFCIQLDNWIPLPSALQTLQGYQEHCTGLGNPVRTLMPYSKWNGDTSLFSATDVAVYDTTDPSESPIPGHAITDGHLAHTQFATVANTYLVCANGVDPMFMWNGSIWITFTEVGSPTDPGEISGVSPSDISFVFTYKRRLWMAEKNTMTAYYLPTDALAGAATPFYLGGVFTRGGYLVDMMAWSFNSSASINSYIVFRSSAGELAVYQGTDPSDATTWELAALYFVAPPIGNKSSTELGGDALVLTSTGMLPMSKISQGADTEVAFEGSITRYINPIISRLYAAPDFGNDWEVHNFSSLQGLLIALPTTEKSAPVQFFMSTITGAWSRLHLPAECFASIGARIFFGGHDGKVYEYGKTGLAGVKLDGTGGKQMECYLFAAYTYLQNPAALKHFKMVRPTFQADSEVPFRLVISTDFDINARSNAIGNLPSEASTDRWNSAIWDASVWRANLTVVRPWTTVTGVGMCAAIVMKVLSDNPILLTSFDWLYEPGTAI